MNQPLIQTVRLLILAGMAVGMGLVGRAHAAQPQNPPAGASLPALSDFQRRQLAEYAPLLAAIQQGKHVDPKVLFQTVHKPIAYANQCDFERNKGMAEELVRRAQEANEKNPERAKGYMRLAKSYKDYAECNLAVVKAFEAANPSAMSSALSAVLRAGKVLESATGKPAARDWFTPQEAEVRIMVEANRRKAAAAAPRR